MRVSETDILQWKLIFQKEEREHWEQTPIGAYRLNYNPIIAPYEADDHEKVSSMTDTGICVFSHIQAYAELLEIQIFNFDELEDN